MTSTMTEPGFPFGDTAEPAPFEVDDAAGPGGRRKLLAGGLVAALVLGAGGFLLLGGGGSADATPQGLSLPKRTAKVAAAPVEAAPAVVPAASTERIGRNPFKARYVAPPVAPAAAPAAAPAPAPAPVPVQVTIQQPPPSPAPTEYPLTLASTDLQPGPQPQVRTSTWKIDGKQVTVLPGQKFGRHGELVVLAYTTGDNVATVTGAVIQVGDAEPTNVPVGQTVNVL